MKFLKKFSANTEYDVAESSLILPNVSLVTEYNEVHFNKYEYVEIGGTKWATMNIGAEKVTDYGWYFQWGDIRGYSADQVGSGEGQKYFGWNDYKYKWNGSAFDKYNTTDGLTTLEPSDDAATYNWGSDWRMPTTEEQQALVSATTSAFTNDFQGSGIGGVIFTDNEDESKYVFFPAAGAAISGNTSDIDNYGNYNSASSNGNAGRRYIWFGPSGINPKSSVSRPLGFSVRAVHT